MYAFRHLWLFFLALNHLKLDLSTSYVDHLHAHSSAPQSREISPAPSRSPSRHPLPHPPHPLVAHSKNVSLEANARSPLVPPSTTRNIHESLTPTDSTPLLSSLPAKLPSHPRNRSKSFSYGTRTDGEQDCDAFFFEGHHRHELRWAHSSHHSRSLRKTGIFTPQTPPNGPQESGNEAGHQHMHDPIFNANSHGHGHGFDTNFGMGLHHEEVVVNVKIGKERQVVGILVRTTNDTLQSIQNLQLTSSHRFCSWEL